MPAPTNTLVVNGIVVTIATAQRLAPRQGGSRTPAFAGTLRTTVRWTKRVWQVTTVPITDTAAVALEAIDAAGVPVSCSGWLLSPAGATISCDIAVTASQYMTAVASDGTGYLRTLTLTLSEV